MPTLPAGETLTSGNLKLAKFVAGTPNWGDAMNSSLDTIDAAVSTLQDATSPVTSVAGKTGDIELAESDIANLVVDLAGKQASLGYTPENAANKGHANGYASIDATGHVPMAQIPQALQSSIFFAGLWNASTNSPTLTIGQGYLGQAYKVSVDGTQSISGAPYTYHSGDWVIFDGANWDTIDNFESVTSVAGRVGNVTLSESDVTNLSADLAAKAPLASPSFTGVLSTPSITPTGTSPTIVTAGTSLKLGQTGDTYGATSLTLQNRIGANGAIFSSPALNLVDFGFAPQTAPQANFRFEGRNGNQAGTGNGTYGEFQFLFNVLTSAIYGLYTGTVESGVAAGNFNVKTGSINSFSGYKVNGTALAASHLSNGVTGSGSVVLSTGAILSTPRVTGLPVYANNAAAITGGLTAGALYRTGADPDPVCVVH